ncbi:MAG: hypothetical protein ABI630_09695, partial [Betaproteobacteria bacterium]
AEEKARREAEEKARRETEERARIESERSAKEEAAQRARDAEAAAAAEKKAKADIERREAEAAAALAAAASIADTTAAAAARDEVPTPAAPAVPIAASINDSLLADLDSFSMRDDEERERKASEERARAAADAEARVAAEAKAAHEAEERRQHEESEAKRKAAEEDAAREAEAQASREEEERKQREKDIRARENTALSIATLAPGQGTPAVTHGGQPGVDDIDLSDADLDLDDVKADANKLAARSGKDGDKRARDRIDSAARNASRAADSVPAARDEPVRTRRPVKWGKPAAITLLVLVLGGLGLLHVVPLSTSKYETLASDALGQPVKIGAAHLWLVTGPQLRLEGVSIGEGVRADAVRASMPLGSLFAQRKAFSRVEIDGLTIAQVALGGALFGGLKGDAVSVERIVAARAKLTGPLALPPLDFDAAMGSDGALHSITFSSTEGRVAGKIEPKGGNATLELSAGSLALPLVPAVMLSDLSLKAVVTPQAMTVSAWEAKIFDGRAAGTARVAWGPRWEFDGDLRIKQMNASVLAPALMSEGRADARGTFAMAAPTPDKLGSQARLEGTFTVSKGVLGSFSLARALQATGGQAGGRTEFTELSGSGTYNKGAVQLRDLKLAAGLLTATATLDIDAGGKLGGRVNAELGSQRGSFVLSGTSTDPQIRK